MSSILSNENDSLLESFDIIRISPTPEDDEKYRDSIDHNSVISVDAQSIKLTDSLLGNYTPNNSLPSENGTSSFVSSTSQESVIVKNMNSLNLSSAQNTISTKNTASQEAQRTSLTNSRTVSSLNDIGPEIIMGNMQISEIADYSYLSEPKNDNSKVLELQARFKNTEEVLKINNIKLRQQYAKLQKFQNEVQEAAELSAKHIEERDCEIKSLKAVINDLEIKLDNLKAQNEWSQDNFRVNLNFLETENFEFKKTISEKLAIISNMSAEMKKLQDQNIYLANHSKNGTTNSTTTGAISVNEQNSKLKGLERSNSALLAENVELKDLITKFKNEIHAREVHLAEIQERSRYKLTEIDRLNEDLRKEKQKTIDLTNHVGVLEVHLRDCKSDFDKERQERTKLAGNREELLTELKISQKRNQKLLDDLKKFTEAGSSNNTKASPPRTSPPKNQEDFQFSAKSSFICPICSGNFSNYNALERHVQDCLE